MASLLKRGLEREGYAVDVARDGAEALWAADEYSYDTIVLDAMIPPPDGFEVCHRLRQKGRWAPIIMLTARDAVDDRVTGLDAGADDYLLKPFAFAELLARLRALLRRHESAGRETVLRAGDLEVDLLERRAHRGGAEVELTHREFDVLAYLVRHKNRVVTREMLGRDVWKERDYALTNVIEVYINTLRRKLERPDGPPLIE